MNLVTKVVKPTAKPMPAKIAMIPPNIDNLGVSPVVSKKTAFAISFKPSPMPLS